MKRQHERGVTLVEASIAMAVAALLVGMAAPSFNSTIERRAIEGAAAQFATDLQFARSLAVAQARSVRVAFGANARGSCYLLHTGNVDDCRCAAGGATQCLAGAEALKTVQWPADGRVQVRSNTRSMLIDPVHGTVSPTATVRVTGRDDRAIHQVVNILGRVRSCSPQSSMPGYRAC